MCHGSAIGERTARMRLAVLEMFTLGFEGHKNGDDIHVVVCIQRTKASESRIISQVLYDHMLQ